LAEISVAPLEELPPGTMKLVSQPSFRIGVFNCDGELHAIEDRCTHDDGPLCDGFWDTATCTIECPRHGASFDLRTGRALTLPAFLPARTFPVRVEGGVISIEID
jgi:3-phenylpropionate/trans-cinnamate dioxygenase ferredoxin subunit